MAYDRVVDGAALDAGLQSLAEGIRAKGGTSEKLTWPTGFRAAVDAIPTGEAAGKEVTPKEVNFMDHDGTILHAYTMEECAALTQLPPLPQRKGLLCHGWNWTLEQLQALARPVTVGAIYSTEDGATRYRIWVADTARMTISFQWQQTGELEIDWGDGQHETFAENGTKTATHTYSQMGKYTVAFRPSKVGVLSAPPQIPLKEEKPLLQKVAMGAGITKLNREAYKECYTLSEVVLSPHLTQMSEGAFRNCYALKAMCVPASVIDLGTSSFFNCASLSMLSLPATITDIAASSIQYCAAIRSFSTLPNLTAVENYAFQECNSLTSIILPKTVNYIGKNAFSGCSALKRFVCESEVPPKVPFTAFGLQMSDLKIYVPAEGWESYQAAEDWAPYQKYMVPYGKAVGSVHVPSCIFGQTKTVTVLTVGFNLSAAWVSVTSDRPEVASVEQISTTADKVQFTVVPGTAEGIANITVRISDGTDTRNNSGSVQVFRTRPAATWSVEAIPEASYGFSQNPQGYYESQNKGFHDSAAVCRVRFNTFGLYRMILECIQSSEADFDYGLLSKPGQQLDCSEVGDRAEKVFYSFESKTSTAPVHVDYGSVENGENWITVKYLKDSSGSTGNDSLQFKVQMEAL